MSRRPSPLPVVRLDRSVLRELPRTCGVYILRGDAALPIYIGKSVNIRARVMAHWRSSDEARMMSRVSRVECIETAGEIGALLLESSLIKALSPVFNVRLRRQHALCSIQAQCLDSGVAVRIVSGPDPGLDEVSADNLFGLFRGRRAAQKCLEDLAVRHRLCLGLLGLERVAARGCFGRQLGRCDGACIGAEDRGAHDRRLMLALEGLRMTAWPFGGAVDVVERTGSWVQRHRVCQWRHLSTWCSRVGPVVAEHRGRFDLDAYRILLRPIMTGSVEIESVETVSV